MGLASRLNAANAGAAPGGAPPAQQQYGQPQQQSYAPPPQQPQQGQYGAPPPYQSGAYSAPQGGKSQYAPPSGPPPPVQNRPQSQYAPPSGPPPPPVGGGGYGQQYGQPPQQQQYGGPQQQYGQQQAYGAHAPPPPQHSSQPSAATDYNTILQLLQHTVQDQGIQAFYPPGSGRLEQIAQRVAQSGALSRVSQEWKIPLELAMDLAKLALFDDDSGSMKFEEGGSRIDDLRLIVQRCAFAAGLFDDDGIQVRFMNSRVEGNGLKTEHDVMSLISQVKFSGLTPLGTALDQKVLQPLLLAPACANQLQKPVLVIAVTDGVPGGEDRNTIVRVLVNASRTLSATRYGSDALSVQIAQIGNDQHARAFLEELDEHPEVGGLVDCTSNYENEEENFRQKTAQELTPELWLMKLLMGAVDTSYDLKDETR
ncbi:hypothetical protein JCM8547_003891 [Rhodosporidiobolus lusitaniae]